MPRFLTEYDRAQAQGMLWTPAVLRPALWLDAADLSTITIATGVSEWRDKSGNGRHASQATASLQPSLISSTPNGLNAILFDGSDDWMGTAAGSYAAPQYFVAFRSRIASTGFNTFPCLYSARTAPNSSRVGASDITSIIGWSLNGNAWQNANGDATRAQFSGRDVSSLVNWNDFNTGVAPTTAFDAWTIIDNEISNAASGSKQFCLAADTFVTSARCWNLEFGEFIILDSAASVSVRTRVVGYLSWKWGIRLAADHPFANRPPLIGD